MTVNGRDVQLVLISRRGWKRVGTRYHSRGIDDNGQVSNFVETEQIVIAGASKTSYVQVRGSIPLFWEQVVNIKYVPKLVIHDAPKTVRRNTVDIVLIHSRTRPLTDM